MSRPITVLFSFLFLVIGTAARTYAQMTYTAGDIILGFQASAGDGSGSTYVFNLGSSTNFRDGNGTGVVANLNADLAATYGVNWYARNDVYWGIAGVRDPSGAGPNTVVDGDPRATIYISRPAAAPGSSQPWVLPADSGSTTRSGAVISAGNSIAQMQGGYRFVNGLDVPRSPTATSNGRGTVQSTGDISNWSQFNPFTGAAFGGVLAGGVQAPLGTGQSLAHLDVYRLIGRSSALATPNDPVGQGRLIGTFSINAAGEVSFSTPATATGYDAWADSFGLTGADRAFETDLDGDGLKNGVEFVVGGHPRLGNDGEKMPTLTRGEGFMDFVFRRDDEAVDLNPRVEHDTDLVGPWTPAVAGAGGVTVTVDNDAFAVGLDRVTVRIPSAGPDHFARLAVSQ